MENNMKTMVCGRGASRMLLVLALACYAQFVQSETGAVVAVPQTQAADDFDSLRDVLAARGWRVERTADGSTLLIPMGKISDDVVAVPQTQAADDFDSLRDVLAARGWRVERTADGSTLLFPMGKKAGTNGRPAPWQEAVAAPGAARLVVAPADMPSLQALLEANGWVIEPHVPGSLRIVQSPRYQGRAIARAAGNDVKLTEYPGISGSLSPVGSRRKAWEISRQWLADSGRQDLEVGRIRDTRRFYVVTLVQDRPPYRVQNELIISKRTSQLLPAF
jgi:hypothetical protein